MQNTFGNTAHISNFDKLIYQNMFYALSRNVLTIN